MKKSKKLLSLLLALVLAFCVMTTVASAADAVVVTARGSDANPIPVYNNYAEDSHGTVTLDVGETVSDDGVLTFSDYGTVKSNAFNYLTVKSSNENVATVAGSYESGALKLSITGVADGEATITVDYTCTTSGGGDSIYGDHPGAATGKLYYTVTVGTGSGSTDPVDPSEPGDEPGYDEDGYQAIHNEAELRGVAKNLSGKYFLANDITISSDWTPLGWTDNDDVAFTGELEGNGYTITGLGMDYEDGTYVGLFAINEGVIKNLSVVVNDIGGYQYVGAIAGENAGTISNVTVTQARAFATGDGVTGYGNGQYNGTESYAGGIAGRNKAGAVIENSFVNVCVNGYYFIGGITGENRGTIRECAFIGGINQVVANTSGIGYVGGIAGRTNSEIHDCYADLGADVKGQDYVGGAFGRVYDGAQIDNVYVAHNNHVFGIQGSQNTGIFTGAVSGGNTTQCYVVSKIAGTQGGAARILDEDLRDQENFPQTATNWDFETVWKWSSKYPVLRNCGNDTTNHPRQEAEEPAATEYTVTYTDGVDGAAFADQTYTVKEGDATPAFDGTPGREGYIFLGWEPAVSETVTGNATYTATWEEALNEVTVTSNRQEGALLFLGDELKVTAKANTAATITITPTLNGAFKQIASDTAADGTKTIWYRVTKIIGNYTTLNFNATATKGTQEPVTGKLTYGVNLRNRIHVKVTMASSGASVEDAQIRLVHKYPQWNANPALKYDSAKGEYAMKNPWDLSNQEFVEVEITTADGEDVFHVNTTSDGRDLFSVVRDGTEEIYVEYVIVDPITVNIYVNGELVGTQKFKGELNETLNYGEFQKRVLDETGYDIGSISEISRTTDDPDDAGAIFGKCTEVNVNVTTF